MSAVIQDQANGFDAATALARGDGARAIAFGPDGVVSLAVFQRQVRALAGAL